MNQIKIKLLDKDATLPTRANPTDAGLDLYASEECTFEPGQLKMVKTQIAVAIDPGYVGLIRDRSSIGSTGLKVTCGVIDSGYTGEVKVVLINLSGAPRYISKGMRFAQMLLVKIATPDIVEEGDELVSEGCRMARGFGSSGAF